MSTLLHHIHPSRQRSIAEAKKRIERKMAQHIERLIMDVHQPLDAFELWFLARPAPTVDLTTLQDDVENLRADLDNILEVRALESVAPSANPTEYTLLVALLSTTVAALYPPRDGLKMHRVRYEYESQGRKKEHKEFEAARRASLIDE